MTAETINGVTNIKCECGGVFLPEIQAFAVQAEKFKHICQDCQKEVFMDKRFPSIGG